MLNFLQLLTKSKYLLTKTKHNPDIITLFAGNDHLAISTDQFYQFPVVGNETGFPEFDIATKLT